MNKIRLSIQGLAAVLGAVVACADIAPTQFVGSGIVAKMDSSVRMEKARVEIVWGTPCQLAATFTMVNTSATSQEVTVGFPMPARGMEAVAEPLSPRLLTMHFDGEAVEITPPNRDKAAEAVDVRDSWEWYHGTHSFKSGTTEVIVKTVLPASRVYGRGFCESLFYCIETGGKWAGSIGEEEVAIRFPHPIAKDQILQSQPAGYKIEGNTVRWRFKDLNPVGREFDISLLYVRPDAMSMIATMREDLAANPRSTATALKLAKHLMALGYAKSNAGFPPYRLSKNEHAAILMKIAARKDRQTFSAHYLLEADGGYRESSSEWTEARVSLVRILAEVGYRDASSQMQFIVEAERLLQDVLAKEPRNAEAWNIYLGSYWRFSFAATGHWFGQTWMSKRQQQLIDTAARNCPADECIRLWLALRRSAPENRDSTALDAALQRRELFKVDFPNIEYLYY